MTSISASTCNGCAQLPIRNISQRHRPRANRAGSRPCVIRASFRTAFTHLSRLLRIGNRDGSMGRRTPSHTDKAQKTDLLAHAFGHPEGAGLIGPGADALVRAALTEALANGSGITQVIATKADLERLFTGAFSESLLEELGPRLHTTDTLEDAIEHLELEADIAAMTNPTGDTSIETPAILWLATPGPDADVVHETLRHWPGTSLIALMSGPWPHGPTHLIEQTGPRPLPSGPVDLLTAEQAITRLGRLRSSAESS